MVRHDRWTVPLLFVSIALLCAGSVAYASDDELDPAEIERIELERMRSNVDAAFAQIDSPPPERAYDMALMWETSDALFTLGHDVIPFLEAEVFGSDLNRFTAAAYTLGRFHTPEAESILSNAIERFDGAEGKLAQLRVKMLVIALAIQRRDNVLEIIDTIRTDVARMEYIEGWSTLAVVSVILAPESRSTLLEWIPGLERERSPEADVRLAETLQALARIPSPEVVPAASRIAATHPSWRVRRAAVPALTAAETSAAIDRLVAIVGNQEEDARVRVLAALGIESIRPADRFEDLLVTLERTEPTFARAALYRTIAEIDPERAVGALRSHRDRPDPLDRAALLEAVALTGRPEGLNLVRAGLSDTDATVAIRAVEALAEIGSPGALETLLAALNDPRWVVRAASVEQLTSLGDRRAAPRIADRLIRDELSQARTALTTRSRVRTYGEALVHLAYVDALDDIEGRVERHGDPDLVSYLRGLTARLELIRTVGSDVDGWGERLADRDDRVRELAIERLASIGSDAAVSALSSAFDSADSRDRVAILRALGEIARASCRPLLERVLLEPEFDIAHGPELRMWAAWAAWREGSQKSVRSLERSAERRRGQDAEVLVRLALLRGATVAEQLVSYRVGRLERPTHTTGRDQDRLDRLVRDLIAGRELDAYESEPEAHPGSPSSQH